MIRQQSAWILNDEAMTECQIMDISKRGPRSSLTDHPLFQPTSNSRLLRKIKSDRPAK
jgi:hypothetical protein